MQSTGEGDMGVGFFFQAEDGIRDLVRSRGLGDVYKRQLKPITYPRFCRAVEKIMKYYAPRSVPSAAGEEEIFIKKGSSLVRLKLKEILFVEALENYVSVNTRDEKYTIHFTMRGIEQQLPSSLLSLIHISEPTRPY